MYTFRMRIYSSLNDRNATRATRLGHIELKVLRVYISHSGASDHSGVL